MKNIQMENIQDVWSALDRVRNSVSLSDTQQVVEEVSKHVEMSGEDLRELLSKLPARAGGRGVVLSQPGYDFLTAYARKAEASCVLDPFAGVGFVLSAIAEGETVDELVGIQPDLELRKIAEQIKMPQSIQWKSDVSDLLEGDHQFGLIVSTPPFGKRTRAQEISVGGKSIKVRNSSETRCIIQTADLLGEKGSLIFLVPDSFFWSGNTVWHKINQLGVYPHAVISLPSGSLASTNVSSNLVILRQNRAEDGLFVAQLSDTSQTDTILNNLFTQNESKKRELGSFVPKEEFVSFDALQLDDEIRQLARRSGMDEVRFGDVIKQFNTVSQNETFDPPDEGAGEGESAEVLYLPRHNASKDAVLQRQDIGGSHFDYLQLVADPEAATAEFLVRLLNQELGRKLRARWARGGKLKAISVSDLPDQRIYLPDLATQEKVLRLRQQMRDLQTQLHELSGQLWMRPVEVDSVGKQVERLNHDDGVERWVETLPFPLASILWRYYASEKLHLKLDYLLNAFEALAEFLTTLMLSAFRNDETHFKERKAYWLGVDEGYGEALRQSSFGTWSNIAERLAKDTRRMLSAQKRDRCLELYRARTISWVNAVSSKEIYCALDQANTYRNKWKGHTSTTEAPTLLQRRIRKLEDQLSAVRNEISYELEDLHLLKPVNMQYQDGVYSNRVKRLKGSRTYFEETTVETTVPMESDRLHILEEGASRPLTLLPFFKMMPTPRSEQNACYFYNRMADGWKVRWLSYHFDASAEEEKAPVIESPEVVSVLNEILGSN